MGRALRVFPTHECEGAHPLVNNGLLEQYLEQHWDCGIFIFISGLTRHNEKDFEYFDYYMKH
jgi:hypothetical protein